MQDHRTDDGGTRTDLRDTAPAARLPLQQITLQDCFTHAGTSDLSAVLPYLLLQYNELVSEHLALSNAYWALTEGVPERSEPVGLGVDVIPPSSPPAQSRFRLLRRRSTRSVRETGASSQTKSPASLNSIPLPQTPSSHHQSDSASTTPNTAYTSTMDGLEAHRRDVFGAMPPPQAPTHSPKLWRKSSAPGAPVNRAPDSPQRDRSGRTVMPDSPHDRAVRASLAPESPQRDRSARASVLSASPRLARGSGLTNTRTVPSPVPQNTVRVLGFRPTSPLVRSRGDVYGLAPLEHDPLYYSSLRTIHSWVRTPGHVTFRILVYPQVPDDPPPPYLIEKAYADLVQVRERLRTRAQGVADATTVLVTPPAADLFERAPTPWRVAERNAAIDTFLHALQRLPVWYDDVLVQFLSTHMVTTAPIDFLPSLGPCLRQACLLQKMVHSDNWEWRICSLYPHVLAVQIPGSDHATWAMRLGDARIRRQFEDAPPGSETTSRCAMLAIHAAPPDGPSILLAVESNEECNEWLQALLQQTHEANADVPERVASTPEPQRSAEVPVTPRTTFMSASHAPSPRPERGQSTSPGPLEHRSRQGITSLFRANATPEQPGMAAGHDRRRFWHGLLSIGHHGSPDWPSQPTEGGTFGAPLRIAVQESGLPADTTGTLSAVPAVVRRCVDYLEHTRGIEEEGIYRISGSSSAVKALYDCFSAGHGLDLEADSGARIRTLTSDPHNLSSLLKMYLRALPENICATALPDMAHAAELPERTERVHALQRLVASLPPENYSLLRFLCAHFFRVSAASDKNKMTLHNLGIVLSPTLMMPTNLLLALISDNDTIFKHTLISSPPDADVFGRIDSESGNAQATLRDRVQSMSFRSPRHGSQHKQRPSDAALNAVYDGSIILPAEANPKGPILTHHSPILPQGEGAAP